MLRTCGGRMKQHASAISSKRLTWDRRERMIACVGVQAMLTLCIMMYYVFYVYLYVFVHCWDCWGSSIIEMNSAETNCKIQASLHSQSTYPIDIALYGLDLHVGRTIAVSLLRTCFNTLWFRQSLISLWGVWIRVSGQHMSGMLDSLTPWARASWLQ